MNFSSKLLEEAVEAFGSLPGVGKKSALRLVLYLLKQDKEKSTIFANALMKARNEIKECKVCHNLSDEDLCTICANPVRNREMICVVENIRDVFAIEKTNHYKGVYHVLGGVISPMDGIGPEQLKIEELINRVKQNEVEETIMALNPTMEGDTTIFYISQKVESLNVKVTTLARGVAFGGDLEYVDELTLARSIVTRTDYEKYLVQ